MIPASNMKLITTAAALHYLGPRFTYITKFGLSGNTLIVIGSGDPLLGDRKTDAEYGRDPDWIFNHLAAALTAKGVRTIQDIIIDTTVFDDQRVHPNWPRDQLHRWYACEVSGLNFNTNCIAITVENRNGRIVISLDPPTRYVKLVNQVTPIAQGQSAVGAYRNQTPNKLTIRGRCKNKAGPFDVAIERPAAFFGFLLAERLPVFGIRATGNVIEARFDQSRPFVPLAQYTTSLADCLVRCNRDSLGLAAEAMLKTIAARANPDGRNGSWETARRLVTSYLRRIGVDESQFYIDDGSGLSRLNELTAYAIAKVLLEVYHSHYWPVFERSLAVGGLEGTIAKYFQQDPYKGNIRGKTGYIKGVKSFSGICKTRNGDYIFSILANNANGLTRPAINNIAKAIIDEFGPPASPTPASDSYRPSSAGRK